MIRDNVKQICKYQGRKLSEIADALQITRQSLHRFITGSPNLETVQKIARVLGVPEFILLHPEPLAALRQYRTGQMEPGQDGQTAILICPRCHAKLVIQIQPDDSSSQDQQQPNDQTNDAGNMEQDKTDATATEGNKD